MDGKLTMPKGSVTDAEYDREEEILTVTFSGGSVNEFKVKRERFYSVITKLIRDITVGINTNKKVIG
jgi:hypothetical protein